MAVTQRDRGGLRLVFSKEEISRFHLRNFESYKSLERKVDCFESLGTTEHFRIFRLSVYIHVVLPISIHEQFELCFYFKYSKSCEAL